MMVKDTIKALINQVLESKYNLVDINFSIEYPRDDKFGDYATNVAMVVAQGLKRKPMEVGTEIIEELLKLAGYKSLFKNAEIVQPGFINFYLLEKVLQINLKEILNKKEKFGSSGVGEGKTIIIDYSSPNVAKHMHVGTLRTTIIGDSLFRIFESLGYNIISDNHIGDWGTQYGILLYQYKKKYGDKLVDNITIGGLESMYVEFKKEEKENPDLIEEAKLELRDLQMGDGINLKLWSYFCEISLKEFKNIYKKLDIRPFDLWHGESFYNNQLKGIVVDALKKGVARKSQGAVIIDLKKFNLPPMLIQKSDGAYLYATTDLATIDYRHKTYQPKEILYVVGNEQEIHFKQLFKSSELLGLHSDEKLVHINLGLIAGKDGKKFSTRTGGAVKLFELIDEAIIRATKIVRDKNSNLSEEQIKEIAKQIGIGALKYADLSQNRLSNILFDWDKMLSLEKGSAAYLQYTYVRIKSIFRKINREVVLNGLENLIEKNEESLLKYLLKFPEIVLSAAKEYKPNVIANYLEELATVFHRYYENVSILNSDKEKQGSRLALVTGVAQVIQNGLKLLGIGVLEKM